MSDRIFADIMTIATGIIGLAIIAVVVSNKASTGTVINDAGKAFSSILGAAVAPVTGSSGISSLPTL
jgi:glycerol uptake facilitator-like aquaporin